MTIMLLSSTGLEETPSSSTTKPVISSEPTRLPAPIRQEMHQQATGDMHCFLTSIIHAGNWRAGTTINNPKSLGLNKPVLYLQAYLWFGHGCNDRLLNCCADPPAALIAQAMRAGVDLTTLCEGEPDIFSNPVFDHLNRKVTPPDLRKDRQFALGEELLKPKYSLYGFKTADLTAALPQYFRNSTQTAPAIASP